MAAAAGGVPGRVAARGGPAASGDSVRGGAVSAARMPPTGPGCTGIGYGEQFGRRYRRHGRTVPHHRGAVRDPCDGPARGLRGTVFLLRRSRSRSCGGHRRPPGPARGGRSPRPRRGSPAPAGTPAHGRRDRLAPAPRSAPPERRPHGPRRPPPPSGASCHDCFRGDPAGARRTVRRRPAGASARAVPRHRPPAPRRGRSSSRTALRSPGRPDPRRGRARHRSG